MEGRKERLIEGRNDWLNEGKKSWRRIRCKEGKKGYRRQEEKKEGRVRVRSKKGRSDGGEGGREIGQGLQRYMGLHGYLEDLHGYMAPPYLDLISPIVFSPITSVSETFNANPSSPHLTFPCHRKSFHTLPCPTRPYLTSRYFTPSNAYYVLPYHTIPYLTIPCLTTPYLNLPYLTSQYRNIP